jgi:hypothetical protein
MAGGRNKTAATKIACYQQRTRRDLRTDAGTGNGRDSDVASHGQKLRFIQKCQSANSNVSNGAKWHISGTKTSANVQLTLAMSLMSRWTAL